MLKIALFVLMLTGCAVQSEIRPAALDYRQVLVSIEKGVDGKYESMGSASSIHCKKIGDHYEVTFLTAKHVTDSVTDGRIVFHDKRTLKIEKIINNKMADASLVMTTSQSPIPVVSLYKGCPIPLTEITTAGYPLGLGLVITKGVINYDSANISDKSWICTACAIYGNSGGGVFDNSGSLVGITVMVAAFDGPSGHSVIPHIQIFLPVCSLLDFLKENGYE